VVVRAAQRPAEVEAALALRVAVFCTEQGVPREEEIDARDEQALHLIAVDDGALLGTCRLLFDTEAGVARLGRMAVRRDARRRGVGGALLQAALAQARKRGMGRVRLNAQRPAEALYAGPGFRVIGAPFQEAGIEHVAMELSLVAASPPPGSGRSAQITRSREPG